MKISHNYIYGALGTIQKNMEKSLDELIPVVFSRWNGDQRSGKETENWILEK